MKITNSIHAGFLSRGGKIVELDNGDWFDYRETSAELPKVGAFCKKCAQESAKPIYPIYMNGKEAYALRCEKCNSEYPMYVSTFKTRYIGCSLPNGGIIESTHGVKSLLECMDRRSREYYNDKAKRVENSICEGLNISHEEYNRIHEGYISESKKAHKRFEKEQADRRAQYDEKKIKEESNKRKELIAQGKLKYVKGVGLVNTETNEIVKL